MSLYRFIEEYAAIMVTAGVIVALADYVLFAKGLITRKITLRGCLMMGLLWPLFAVMLFALIWKKWR